MIFCRTKKENVFQIDSAYEPNHMLYSDAITDDNDNKIRNYNPDVDILIADSWRNRLQ